MVAKRYPRSQAASDAVRLDGLKRNSYKVRVQSVKMLSATRAWRLTSAGAESALCVMRPGPKTT